MILDLQLNWFTRNIKAWQLLFLIVVIVLFTLKKSEGHKNYNVVVIISIQVSLLTTKKGRVEQMEALTKGMACATKHPLSFQMSLAQGFSGLLLPQISWLGDFGGGTRLSQSFLASNRAITGFQVLVLE